jgi:hypothetical protein
MIENPHVEIKIGGTIEGKSKSDVPFVVARPLPLNTPASAPAAPIAPVVTRASAISSQAIAAVPNPLNEENLPPIVSPASVTRPGMKKRPSDVGQTAEQSAPAAQSPVLRIELGRRP